MADLDAGKWRRARDGAKELAKKDKVRYTPLVTAANAGLAHEMLSRGLTKDAEPVLAALEKVASPEVLAWVRSGTAPLPVMPAVRAVEVKGFTAESWAAVVALAAELESGGQGPAEGWRAADLLAGATKAPPAPPEAAVVEAEWHLVQRAVESAGAGQWEAMQEALRGLPRTSVFQHWRMLLRGVRAVHTGERETAVKCFAALPAGSAPARAAQPWRQWLGESEGALPRAADAVLGAMCGVPTAWIEGCRNAEAPMLAARRREVWKILRQAMKDEFPTVQPGFAGEITSLALHTREPVKQAEGKEYDAFLDQVAQANADRLFKKQPEQLATLLFYLNGMEPVLYHDDLELVWREALTLAGRVWGPLPLRDAVVWRRLAQHYSSHEHGGLREMMGFGAWGNAKPKLHDAKAAKRVLERAVQLDPDNEAAAMDLVALLDATGDTSARNKLLDDLVKRAPQNRLVLHKAGALAIERKAFGKGLDMLRQARLLDPLNLSVAMDMTAGLIGQARDRQKKRPSATQDDIWQEMETLAVDRCDRSDPARWPAMLLERWAMRLRRSLLDGAHAPQAAEEAERMAPSLFGCLLLRGMLSEVYLKKLPTAQETARLEKAAKAATWGDLHEALQVWQHVSSIPSFSHLTAFRWGGQIQSAARSTALAPDDADGAWRVAVFLEASRGHDHTLNPGGGFGPYLGDRILGAVKKNGGTRLEAAWLLFSNEFSPKANTLCSTLLARAKSEGLADVERALERWSREANPLRGAMSPIFGDDAHDENPNLDDDDEEDGGDDIFDYDGPPPDLDKAMVERAMQLMDLVGDASEAQLDALHARLVAEGLEYKTAEDTIGLALALSGMRDAGMPLRLPKDLLPPPPKPKAAKPRPAKKSGPNHPELF